MTAATTYYRVTNIAAAKLASVSGDILAMTPEQQLELTRQVRASRKKPVKSVKASALKIEKFTPSDIGVGAPMPEAKPRKKKSVTLKLKLSKKSLLQALEELED